MCGGKMTDEAPARLIDWQGKEYARNINSKKVVWRRMPTSRVTVPAAQCPSMDAKWEDPAGFDFGIRFGSAARRPCRW